MPKFKFLKQGVNKDLMEKTKQKVEKYLSKILEKDELITLNDIYSFKFGTVMVQITILPFHSEDVLVEVFSYLAEKIKYTPELGEKLLRMNATLHFGAFGITYDDSVVFTYSLAGSNLDFNEFLAAVQSVATIADSHDELIKEMSII